MSSGLEAPKEVQIARGLEAAASSLRDAIDRVVAGEDNWEMDIRETVNHYLQGCGYRIVRFREGGPG